MINYVIAKYGPTGEIGPYTSSGKIVFRNTEKDAFAEAQKISAKTKEKYHVFQLCDIGTYYDPDPC